ncbi:hypothetical protein FOCC_FOCC017260, partial [Frankliniella occidentalis]
MATALLSSGKSELGEAAQVKGKHWYDEECVRATEQRNALWRWITEESLNDDEVREGYEEAERLRKKTLRRVRRRYFNQLCKDLELDHSLRNVRGFFAKVKKAKTGYVPRACMVRAEEGLLVANTPQVLQTWRKHCIKVLATPATGAQGHDTQEAAGAAEEGTEQQQSEQQPDEREKQPPTREEVTSVLSSMKRGKAAGADGITTELFLAGGEAIIDALTALMVRIWEEESIPAAWEEAVITMLHKGKGGVYDCDNYRGLSLLNTGYKVCSTLILRRLEFYAEAATSEYQAGFRKNRSTTDHIYALRVLLARRKEFQQETHMLFVDFAKAYDSVDREVLWRRLAELDIPQKLIIMMQALSRSTRNRVRAMGFLSDCFETTSGVRQGDSLSPQLFNLALESAVRRVLQLLHPDVLLLAYADDIVIVANSAQQLSAAMAALVEKCAEIGLRVNHGKTKYMRSAPAQDGPSPPLQVADQTYEAVRVFRYLGSMITVDNDSLVDIRERTNAALRNLRALRSLLGSREINRKGKLTIYETVIRPVATYGGQAWTLTAQCKEALNVFERKVLRIIVGPDLSQPGVVRMRSSQEVRDLLGYYRSVVSWVQSIALHWAGHVERAPEDRIIRQ